MADFAVVRMALHMPPLTEVKCGILRISNCGGGACMQHPLLGVQGILIRSLRAEPELVCQLRGSCQVGVRALAQGLELSGRRAARGQRTSLSLARRCALLARELHAPCGGRYASIRCLRMQAQR
uniref:Uncharacterized protein n=1 Tax=Pyrodinium bahamense TaxID=73915 RepID=A0A7S0FYP1_9DINO